MAKTKITLHRQVTYGIAESGADPATPTFDRVVVSAKVEADDPMDSRKRSTGTSQLVVDLPSKAWDETDVLAAMKAAYPECDVDWLEVGENV